jgi:hypothetical protein
MCDSCEILYINGNKCHEAGCPEQFKDEVRSCAWCGQPFEPAEASQKYCGIDCYCCDNDIDNDETPDGFEPYPEANVLQNYEQNCIDYANGKDVL